MNIIKNIIHIPARAVLTRSLTFVVGLVFGLIIMAQLRSIPLRVPNPAKPYLSLMETKELLYKEQEELKLENKSVQERISIAQDHLKDTTLNKGEITALNKNKAQAGLTKLNGKGLVIVLDDSPKEVTEDSIVHAADLRDIINLLWGSTAEGITINSERVVSNTSIDCIVNTILVNNSRLSNPYKIEAIGDPETLYSRLTNKSILSDIHRRVESEGLVLDISKNDNITLPQFGGSLRVQSTSSTE